jgi:uncharacterized Zn-binding protein involved in type VI secretion
MGKPAARRGDMTAHGGCVVVGCPTVLIGGMPAARLMDMHVCPMATPGTPPIPHVGGPIILGSAGVLIGGMPAARMGDMATCVGPPDMIALGCMTVLIGETMAGAAAAPGPVKVGLNSAAAAQLAAATALSDNTEASTKEEHWAEFQFVDSAGLPVSGVHYKFTDPDGKESEGVLKPDGKIRRDALNAGQCKAQLFSVSNAKWSKDKADVGEKVKLTADVEGFEDGTKTSVQIFRRDIKGPDVPIQTIEVDIKNRAIETSWEYILPENKERERIEYPWEKYSAPEYYFEVNIGQCKARSRLLSYRDWIEIRLKDQDGNPLANQEYELHLPDGSIQKGKLDGNGYKKVENLPPGRCFVSFPDWPTVDPED